MPILNGFSGNFLFDKAITILNTATASSAIDCAGLTLCGVKFPAVFTGTTITFQMCDTIGGTYVPVHNAAGTAITYTIAASRYAAIDPKDFHGINFLKIVAGTAQAADRTLTVSLKGF